MIKNNLYNLFCEHKYSYDFSSILKKKKEVKIHLKGLTGSSKSLFAASYIQSNKKINVILLNDKEDAAYFYNDLTSIIDKNNLFFLPSSYKRSVQYNHVDKENIILRTQIINKLLNSKEPFTIVSYPEAIIEKVITYRHFENNTLALEIGENISIDQIADILYSLNFNKVDFVYEPGQFSIRGSIVDIFSFSNSKPYRIDFFGDDIDSIRSFNIENQISDTTTNKIVITPNFNSAESFDESKKVSLFKVLDKNSIIWINNIQYITDRLKNISSSVFEENNLDNNLNKDIINDTEFINEIKNYNIIEFGQQFYFQTENTFNFNISPQPNFNKNFDLLAENLLDKVSKNIKIYISSENEKQIERIHAIFKDKGQNIPFNPFLAALHEGFVDNDLGFCYYTDHQIFDRYHKFKLDTGFTKSVSLTLKEINDLHPGDYIVHIDHGIGIFGGLEKVTINGKNQEAVRLVYKNNDILYVSIHSLHRISKYKGKDNTAPKIYKLGSGAWQKLKQTTKNKVKDIAKNLIALYAKRKAQEGFNFSPDTYLQNELEASFIYEDTPDQIKATADVKEGMESKFPMDRLVCGDVGFGKTEVAIRASFKAVADNKQVAILVPTTILALQHYNTFKNRLRNFPCNVDYISRLRNSRDKKTALKNLKEGKTDIIIGTHRLVGKDVQFKDLGLLIIDEEQKFGVAVKEKLKNLKLNIDTLTLTATPIPRTLQFSLMGARDLSIINTPPPNRHPILTELHTFDDTIIREAITYEIERNGQIFFINNRIQNIYEIQDLINKICPKAKTIVAHGQMEGPKLEKIMMDFINGLFDVLIATTIIESGLDIPNANTIIINNAQNFGLSDLHQLRGRVGRSNKKAFCYLLAPPLTSVTPEARRRLKAIEDFSELGSGFNIAMQDLDIRGAGNLLGGEQSGFIADIGFETYHKILNEALQELKEEEFEDLFDKTPEKKKIQEIDFLSDCYIDTDLEILFPENYIFNVSERIRLYKELDNINNEDELEKFKIKLIDRFGEIPVPTLELLDVVKMRWVAIKLGFEKIFIKNEKMILHFVSNPTSLYYQSDLFSSIIKYIQSQKNIFNMKEEKNKLILSIKNISTISAALQQLRKIKSATKLKN